MRRVAISGGFDPIHVGHIEYIKAAKRLGGWLVVILNSDKFLIDKKGQVFMPYNERKTILENIKGAFNCCMKTTANIDNNTSSVIIKNTRTTFMYSDNVTTFAHQ